MVPTGKNKRRTSIVGGIVLLASLAFGVFASAGSPSHMSPKGVEWTRVPDSARDALVGGVEWTRSGGSDRWG